jgi:ABC-type multidrug transport system ATPase subunit
MTPLLAVDGVARKYGTKRILRGISFSADAGQTIGIIGPNGAGKTTLLRIVVGLLRADSGSVRLDGEPVRSAIGRIKVGYFAGETTVPSPVRARAWRSLFQDVDDRGDNRPVRLLSRGTRQLLGLRTVFSVPALRLLVLDEPWEGLDPDASRWLSEAMCDRREAGMVIVVSSHRLHDLAGVCDRYVVIDRGLGTSIAAHTISDRGMVTGEALLAAFDDVRARTR